MQNKDFFDKVTPLTEEKIEIYKEYITAYIPKIFMTWGKFILFDLFCGPGKNEDINGSPLVLIEQIEYLLSNQTISKKTNLQALIYLNDNSNKYINSLKKNIDEVKYNKDIIRIELLNEEYSELFENVICKLPDDIPKFIFLDPFSYADVTVNQLLILSKLKNIEILLFVPIHHIYRFAKIFNNYEKNHKPRLFIEQFTDQNINEFHDPISFILNIKKTLCEKTDFKFVRPILLNNKSKKNALFLMSNHIQGIHEINKIINKRTQNGLQIDIFDQNQIMIEIGNPIEYSIICKNAVNIFKERIKNNDLTNEDIVEIFASEGIAPKNTKKILIELWHKKFFRVFSDTNIEIETQNKWNIAEKITKRVYFRWEKK